MISRRGFLQNSAVVSLGLAIPGIFSKAVGVAAEEKADKSMSGKTLVVIQMAGGVDGLNTVIPYTDPVYRDLRRGVGIPENEMLVVDDRIAFHPSFGRMRELFQSGNVAVIEGVGYPDPSYSHFKAMDIWQTADPRGTAEDGWLGRYFDEAVDVEGHPLAGLNVGRSLPSAFESPRVSLPSVESLETFSLAPARGDPDPMRRQETLMRLYDIYRPANTPFAALLDTTLDNAFKSSTELTEAHAAYQPAVEYPQSSMASGLRLLAELIDSGGAAGSPLRVGHVTIGGFDTHTQQPARFAQLLQQANDAIYAFWQDISSHGHADDVLVMTWSEFGRRVAENAQMGTDHGSAGPMFIVGKAIKGGFHGAPPSLSSLDDGNLRFTTDFRSVYATLIEGWLQSPSDQILGGRFDKLTFLA